MQRQKNEHNNFGEQYVLQQRVNRMGRRGTTFVQGGSRSIDNILDDNKWLIPKQYDCQRHQEKRKSKHYFLKQKQV